MTDHDIFGFADGATVYPIIIRAMALRLYGNYVDGGADIMSAPATSGMFVTVATRNVYVNGADSGWNVGGNLAVATAHATLDRYDLVVADISATNEAIVTGTASASPQVPNTGETRDIPIAIVKVRAASTQIYDGDIIEVKA